MTLLAKQSSSQLGQWSGQGFSPCLPSPLLQMLFCLRVFLPWRTFTLSVPLQPGIWLLRRLRPPFHTLAFSRPTEVGQVAWEFPSSNTRDVLVTLSCLLHTGRIGNNTCRRHGRQAHRHPILGQVFHPLSPVYLHDALDAGSSRQHRSQDWSVSRMRVPAAELLSAGFRPLGLPVPDACRLVPVLLFKNSPYGAISRAVKGRASLKGGGSCHRSGSPRLSLFTSRYNILGLT
jgi:hypothetical protein